MEKISSFFCQKGGSKEQADPKYILKNRIYTRRGPNLTPNKKLQI
jgi:hypothetical protein